MPSLDQLRNLALDYGPSLIGPVSSGLINRSAAGAATDKLVAGADRAESVIQPYADVGTEALKSVSNFGLDELLKDPGMQFRMAEGQKLLARRQASGGSLGSGAAFKAMQQYTQNQASQEYGAAWNRLMQRVGIGQEGSRQLVDLISARAEALANGDVAKANALTDMIGGIQRGVQGVQDMKQLEQLLGIGPAGGANAPASAYTRAPMTAAGSIPAIAGLGGAGATFGSIGAGQLGGTAAANAIAAPSLLAGGVPTTALAGPTGVAAAEGAGGVSGALGLGGGSGLLGLGAATIPVIGGAIAAAIMLPKLFGRGRKQADVLTAPDGIQTEFNEGLAKIVAAEQAGEITHDQRLQFVRDAYAQLKAVSADFAAQGGNQAKVVQQMLLHYLTNPVTMEALI